MELPDELPKSLNDTFALSYVVYNLKSVNGYGSQPRRELQRALTRASGQPVSRCLSRLVSQGWLEVDRKHPVLHAHRYRLGSRISADDTLVQWERFSSSIWEPTSPLSPIVDASLATHGSLNFTGVLVLAVFLFRPSTVMTASEVRDALRQSVSVRTVEYRLRTLTAMRLVERVTRGRYVLHSGWLDVISDQGFARRERTRAIRIAANTRAQTANFQRIFGRSGLSLELRSRVLEDNKCAFCGSGVQMEAHEFPPLAWRSEDLEPLWFALCRKCNAREARFIQAHPKESYQWLESLVVDSSLSTRTRNRLYERYAYEFNQQLKLKKYQKAQSIAARLMILMRVDDNPPTPRP